MRGALLSLALVAGAAWAADPPPLPIQGPGTFKHVARFKVDPAAVLIPTATPPAERVTVLADREGEWTVAGGPGTYKFAGVAIYVDIDWDKKKVVTRSVPYSIDFLIQGAPPPPVPPGPNPPDPPGPTPGPAPIPADGFRVLMVWESADAAKYSPGQLAVLQGKRFRDYLDAKCVKVNGWSEYRILDKDQTTANETQIWQDAMKRPRQSVPWVVISNGKSGYEGPLPASADEAIALCDKYAK